jgi:hypothetical protein
MARRTAGGRQPPPSGPAVDPATVAVETIPAGTRLLRIYNPTRHRARELSFRRTGPIMRFDHHRASPQAPRRDPARGIWYGALELETCACEVFGRDGVVRLSSGRLAVPQTARELRLVDLRGAGAERAGVPELAIRTADRELSCAWSRHIYEHEAGYGAADGLIWPSARTAGDCLALYERARDALECPDPCSLPLSHPRLIDALLRIAQRHGYEIAR